MFKKKNKAEEKKGDLLIHFNDGLYKTQSGEVIKFTNIDAYFNTYNGTDPKSTISHDMIRTLLIQKCYEFTYAELTESKTIFESAMRTALNHMIGDTGVKCAFFSIEQTEKVY